MPRLILKPTFLFLVLLSLAWPVIAQNRVLELDGDGDYVALPSNIFNHLEEATVEGWVKWMSFGSYSRFFDFGVKHQSMAVQNIETSPNLFFYVNANEIINFVVRETPSITGRVLALDRSPISRVVVQAVRENSVEDVAAVALTTATGEYRLEGLRPGVYEVRCHGWEDHIEYGKVDLRAGDATANFSSAPFRKGTWKSYSTADGVPTKMNCLGEDHWGRIWINRRSFDGRTFKREPLPDLGGWFSLAQILCMTGGPLNGSESSMWIGTSLGLARLRLQGIESVADPLMLPGHKITALRYDNSERLWIGTEKKGLFFFDGSRCQKFALSSSLSDPSVRAIEIDTSGAVWIASNHGLFRFRPGLEGPPTDIPQHFDQSRDLLSDDIGGLKIDAKNSIWVIEELGLSAYQYVRGETEESGLVLKDRLDREDGLVFDDDDSQEFVIDSDQDLWLAAWNGEGIARYNTRSKTLVYMIPEGAIDSFYITDLFFDRAGRLWVATDMGDLWCYDSRRMTRYTKRDGLPVDSVGPIGAGPDGAIWVGAWKQGNVGGLLKYEESPAGMTSLERGKFVSYPVGVDPLKSPFRGGVVCMDWDQKGNLWVGSNSFKEGVFHGGIFRGQDGLFESVFEVPGFVASIYADPVGDVWVGTSHDGLHRYSGAASTEVDVEPGVIEIDGTRGQAIWNLEGGPEGTVWMTRAKQSVGNVPVEERHAYGFARVKGDNPVELISNPEDIAMASTLTQDGNGGWWVLGYSRENEVLLAHYTGNQVELYGRDYGIPQGTFSHNVRLGPGGHVWMGSNHGVVRFDGITCATQDVRDGLPGNTVYCVYEDELERMWLGGYGGITVFQHRHPTGGREQGAKRRKDLKIAGCSSVD